MPACIHPTGSFYKMMPEYSLHVVFTASDACIQPAGSLYIASDACIQPTCRFYIASNAFMYAAYRLFLCHMSTLYSQRTYSFYSICCLHVYSLQPVSIAYIDFIQPTHLHIVSIASVAGMNTDYRLFLYRSKVYSLHT